MNYEELQAHYNEISQYPDFEETVIRGILEQQFQMVNSSNFEVHRKNDGLVLVRNGSDDAPRIFNLRDIMDQRYNCRKDPSLDKFYGEGEAILKKALLDVTKGEESLDNFPIYDDPYSPGTRATKPLTGVSLISNDHTPV